MRPLSTEHYILWKDAGLMYYESDYVKFRDRSLHKSTIAFIKFKTCKTMEECFIVIVLVTT